MRGSSESAARRVLAILLPLATPTLASDPLIDAWKVNPAAASTRAALPDVHQVETAPGEVVVHSAGFSLQSLGALAANHYDPPAGVRSLRFRFPRQPQPATQRIPVPLGITGALINGVPIYNPVSTLSYADQNLWHRDAIAMSAERSPLLQALLAAYDRHSPIIGYALDGYPIYGPFGYDGQSRVQRMRSSYRLRSMSRRSHWPDGTALLPGQQGPAVNAEQPLGTYTEDYEYAEGHGDLDESNARFARTPEYPHGTYAYFLTTDAAGRLAFPYLIGPTYRGQPITPASGSSTAQAGTPFAIRYDIRNQAGRPQLFLEKRHQKPMHLLIASGDLSEFFHVHPAPQPGGGFAIEHTFPHGGTYHLYADYAMAGQGPVVEHKVLQVSGEPRPQQALTITPLTQSVAALTATLAWHQSPRTGVDLPFDITLDVNDLEPFLDAWAHFVILSQDHAEFIHAHPLEEGAVAPVPELDPHEHKRVSGPSPSRIHSIAGFRRPGQYKLWAQFQRAGQVITFPFVFDVAPGGAPPAPAPTPPGAIRVEVSAAGFTPASVPVNAGQRVRLAFLRKDAQNCGGVIRFPDLGITRVLPPGEQVLVEFAAPKSGALAFTCGMGMLRGAVVVGQ